MHDREHFGQAARICSILKADPEYIYSFADCSAVFDIFTQVPCFYHVIMIIRIQSAKSII